MSIDFNDPTTWDGPLSEADAINLGIWALNTIAHPDASTDSQFAVSDFFHEGAVDVLDRLRERLEALEEFGKALDEIFDDPNQETWVVETIYNTDPEGKWVDDDDYSNRTLHGPFDKEGAQKFLEEFCADDTDVKDMSAFPLNRPESTTD